MMESFRNATDFRKQRQSAKICAQVQSDVAESKDMCGIAPRGLWGVGIASGVREIREDVERPRVALDDCVHHHRLDPDLDRSVKDRGDDVVKRPGR